MSTKSLTSQGSQRPAAPGGTGGIPSDRVGLPVAVAQSPPCCPLGSSCIARWRNRSVNNDILLQGMSNTRRFFYMLRHGIIKAENIFGIQA